MKVTLRSTKRAGHYRAGCFWTHAGSTHELGDEAAKAVDADVSLVSAKIDEDEELGDLTSIVEAIELIGGNEKPTCKNIKDVTDGDVSAKERDAAWDIVVEARNEAAKAVGVG